MQCAETIENEIGRIWCARKHFKLLSGKSNTFFRAYFPLSAKYIQRCLQQLITVIIITTASQILQSNCCVPS